MGRPSQTTNPEETNGSWAPVGDDAAGWVWTTQLYDWKGRPTITTNPDGTTKEAVYGGCGCAGGQVMTVSDEGTLINGVLTRRKQRSTSDVLGRPFKTEVYDWDGSTVYSTTITTYNARDQITNVKQYQGTEASGVYQESTMTYDGYGRLSASHAPDQRDQNNQPLSTTFTYNPDDTTNVVTDARGATKTFAYNNRHLVTSLAYTAPSGIANTGTVTFNYDATGNRTGMTDGTGSTSYQYDQLSRLTSETRSFTSLGSYTLSYGYNLSGALTSVTDQWGVQVGYSYDQTGRLTSVTGSGGGASLYASDMQYRAWGALKHLTYGNNLNLDLLFNNRLQTTKYDLKTQAGARIMGREYQYTTTLTSADNDGRVKYSRDLVANNLDRTYVYDNAGRLLVASAGVNNGSYYSGPFQQSYTKDVWGNLTGRSWRTFGSYNGYIYPQSSSYNDNYVNNRNTATGWQYDANGSLLTSTGDGVTRQQTYDSTGMMLTSSQTGKNITAAYDGDGQRVKFSENSTTTYYVRSSVLGGQTITELNQYGAKVRGYVYAGGTMIAKQEGSQVLWDQRDITGVSMRLTNSNGAVTSKIETDPLGTQVDDTANYNYSSGGSGGFNPNGFYGTPQMPNMGCTADGVPTSCAQVQRWIRDGIAAPCPGNICSPRSVVDGNGNRQWQFYRFTAEGAGWLTNNDFFGVTRTERPRLRPRGQTGPLGNEEPPIRMREPRQVGFLLTSFAPTSAPQNNGQGLSDCLQKLLGQFFSEPGVLFPKPMDLSAVRVHDGIPKVVDQFAVIDVEAITVANDIYAVDIARFEGREWRDIELIAHELVHVQQYAELRKIFGLGSEALGSVGGTLAYGALYLGGFIANLILGKDTKKAEADNPFEKDAAARAKKIVEQLKADGKKPCT
jgi:YD repeat-containing protein